MRVIDHSAVDKQDLRHMTDSELEKMGLRMRDRTDLVLECAACGETWKPELDSNGKLHYDYWLCPMRCNE